MQHINPYDVLSIDVLKDEKATKKWGEKGANGVVIISMCKFDVDSYRKNED